MRVPGYARPETVEELLAVLADEGPRARIVAGGTDLWLAARAGLALPTLVNVFRIPDMRRIVRRDGFLEVGATATVADLLQSNDVLESAPLLRAAADRFASPLVRSRATVGGNLCNASPAADLSLALLALDADVRIESRSGARTLPVADFVLGPRRTALAVGEAVTGAGVPVRAGRVHAFEKSGPRPALEISVVAVAVAASIEDGRVVDPRICCGAVAPTPMRARAAEKALAGRPLEDDAIADAARAAAEEIRPIDDVRAGAVHRRRLVAAFVRRALESVRSQARCGSAV
jgi:CO/xanthine dehydrogenase FAD-binding subunit